MTQSIDGSIETISHQVDRLTIRIDDSFDGFRHRYEQAVPVFQTARFESLVERRVDWRTVLAATAENAPHDFILYWSHDFTSLMSLAGDRGRCIEYLMGNHTIAQRMYRYNPAILLYAPLRTAIVEDADGATWFTVDQPSTRFASFDIPQITVVGIELDHKLAALLAYLGVPVPAALAESSAEQHFWSNSKATTAS
jgi:hypothetical protein